MSKCRRGKHAKSQDSISVRLNIFGWHSKHLRNMDAKGQDAISFVFLVCFIFCRNVAGASMLGVKI